MMLIPGCKELVQDISCYIDGNAVVRSLDQRRDIRDDDLSTVRQSLREERSADCCIL